MKRLKRSSIVSLALSIPTSSPQSLLHEESRDNAERGGTGGPLCGTLEAPGRKKSLPSYQEIGYREKWCLRKVKSTRVGTTERPRQHDREGTHFSKDDGCGQEMWVLGTKL